MTTFKLEDFAGEKYLFIDMSTVVDSLTDYVKSLETDVTTKHCKCEWIVHPDDVRKPESQARRIRKGEATLDCPVHTKEGFLLGFLNYMLSQAGKPAINLSTYAGD